MVTVTSAPTVVEVPSDARCLKCGYSLRDLLTARCPECGTPFDPSDPWSMNVGRPYGSIARFLLTTCGTPTFVATIVATAVVALGTSGLGGSGLAMRVGLILWFCVYFWRASRAMLRRLTARFYRQPVQRKSQRKIVVALIVTGLLIWTHLPAKIIFELNRGAMTSVAKKYYEQVPFLDPPRAPTWIGPYHIGQLGVYPNGVDIQVDPVVEFYYRPERAPAAVWSSAPIDMGGGWYLYLSPEAGAIVPIADRVRYWMWWLVFRHLD